MTELLTKLSPHARFPDGSASGGSPDITAEDVMQACAGLGRHIYLYALVKFAGFYDPPTIAGLKREMFYVVRNMYALMGWNLPRHHLRPLTGLALNMMLVPNYCRRCHGAGRHHNQRPCAKCSGTGIGKPLTAAEKAEAVGVEVKDWAKYEDALGTILNSLSLADDKIARHIKRKLRGAKP